MASRRGTLLEKNLEQLLKLTGFKPELNKIFKGYEIDVFLRYANFKIGFECKQYESSKLGVRNLIHQWDSKNKELNLDRIIFVITGVDISQKEHQLANKCNIIIWDEKKLSFLLDEAIDKRTEIKEKIIKEMGISSEKTSDVESDEEEDDKFVGIIRKELETLIEKNSSETPKSETTASVYPHSLHIDGADGLQIQYALNGGVRIFFTFPTAHGTKLFVNILDNFKLEKTNKSNPSSGEYKLSEVGVIVSFGEDLELASQIINESLITMYNFDANKQIKFKHLGKSACFIATASYGTPFAEEINILRFWRDNFLLKNYFGTLFVNTYYNISPPIARFIQKRRYLRASVRFCLNPFIRLLKLIYKK